MIQVLARMDIPAAFDQDMQLLLRVCKRAGVRAGRDIGATVQIPVLILFLYISSLRLIPIFFV